MNKIFTVFEVFSKKFNQVVAMKQWDEDRCEKLSKALFAFVVFRSDCADWVNAFRYYIVKWLVSTLHELVTSHVGQENIIRTRWLPTHNEFSSNRPRTPTLTRFDLKEFFEIVSNISWNVFIFFFRFNDLLVFPFFITWHKIIYKYLFIHDYVL